MKASLQFECTACNEVYKYLAHAEECCSPPIHDVWVCGECDDLHESKEEAEECCVKKRDPEVYCPKCMRFPKYEKDYEQIVITGTCSSCTPVVTYVEKAEIEDLYYNPDHSKTK